MKLFRRSLAFHLGFALLLVAGACGSGNSSDSGSDSTAPVQTTQPTQPDATEPDTTQPDTTQPDTTQPDPAPVSEVGDLFDGEGPRDTRLGGFVLWDSASARFCGVLMESFPPQCGNPWVVIANPDSLDVKFEDAQGVRWTQGSVEVDGHFDGDRFVVGSLTDLVAPSESDKALVTAFAAFAAAPNEATAAALPLAEMVTLGLGSDILSEISATELADPQRWTFLVDDFQGYAGPFSALDLVEEPFTITVGSHPRCAGPPVPPPAGFEDARRLSIQPELATSCLEWWTVDFFLDGESVAAVTMDLFGP